MVRSICLVVTLLVGSTLADDFPPDLVTWAASPTNPVFTGAGDAGAWDEKIRERGWILIEDDVYHLWYTGYNDAQSPNRSLGHAQSPDGMSWTRDPGNPILDTSWVEDVCVVKNGDTYYMVAEGAKDIAHLLTAPDPNPLDRARAARHPAQRWRANRAGTTRDARPVRQGWRLVTLLRARRPGGLARADPATPSPSPGSTSRMNPSWRWAPTPTTSTPSPSTR